MLTSTDLKALEPHNGRKPVLYSYSITSSENCCRISATRFSSSSKDSRQLVLSSSSFILSSPYSLPDEDEAKGRSLRRQRLREEEEEQRARLKPTKASSQFTSLLFGKETSLAPRVLFWPTRVFPFYLLSETPLFIFYFILGLTDFNRQVVPLQIGTWIFFS